MTLNQEQKSTIIKIVNVFETGNPEGDYSSVTVLADGPSGQRQITYGRSQTTEHSDLDELLKTYFACYGIYSKELSQYVPMIGSGLLADSERFKAILNQAGGDAIMHKCQDELFERKYWDKAEGWADENLFFLPLSMLVIYDSYIHSGHVPNFLRDKFSEPVPANGGDEKDWVNDYTSVRQAWLKTAANPVLHSTVYRTQCFKNLIKADNWSLELPIMAHGVLIK